MNNKKTTDFGKTETEQDWDALDSLSPDQRARVDDIMAHIKTGSSGLDHHWGRAPKSGDNVLAKQSTEDGFKTTTAYQTSHSSADGFPQFEAMKSGFSTSIPDPDASPGAVPRTSGMRRLGQLVLLLLAIEAGWLAGRSLGWF